MIHHYRKGRAEDKFGDKKELVRGSGEWTNYPHLVIAIDKIRSPIETGVKQLTIVQEKNRLEEKDETPKLIEVGSNENGDIVFEFKGDLVSQASKKFDFVGKLMEYMITNSIETMKTKEIIEQFGSDKELSKSTITSSLSENVKNGTLVRVKTGYYSLADVTKESFRKLQEKLRKDSVVDGEFTAQSVQK